jgi:hypothetical protein
LVKGTPEAPTEVKCSAKRNLSSAKLAIKASKIAAKSAAAARRR